MCACTLICEYVGKIGAALGELARDRFPVRERDDLVAQLEEAEGNNAGS